MVTLFALLVFAAIVLLVGFGVVSATYTPRLYDSLTQLRTTGNLTATDTRPLAVAVQALRPDQVIRISVPQATGTSPTLDIKIQDSADNSTYNDVFTFRQIVAAGVFWGRVHTARKWVAALFTVGGTSPNFGVTVAGFESGMQYDMRQPQ